MKKKTFEVRDYDLHDTVEWINRKKGISLKDLGFTLPPQPPSQVVSIRFPTILLNRLRALASTDDIPYQALIKMVLANYLRRHSPA